MAGTITQLGGLSLLHVQPDALHLKLVTAYPTAAVRGADPGPCATADHELSLQLLPGAGNTGGWGGWVPLGLAGVTRWNSRRVDNGWWLASSCLPAITACLAPAGGMRVSQPTGGWGSRNCLMPA